MAGDSFGGQPLTAMTSAWATMARGAIEGTTAANRAAVSAMLPASSACSPSENGTKLEPSIPSIDHDRPDWEFERSTDDPASLGVGDSVVFSKPLTEADVEAFAEVSGDTNRLHLDEAYASETRFGGRIVHGTLVSGLISSALARLPGLTIYLSQDLEFLAPVRIGDRVSASVEIVEDLGDRRFRLETVVRDEDAGETVVDGEAIVLIDDAPDA